VSRLLAITMGDPAGVGPEVIVGSWEAPALQAACRRVVVGRTAVVQRAVSLLGRSLSVERVTSLDRISTDPLLIPVWECGDEAADQVQAGKISAAAGSASRDALLQAIDWARDGAVDAIVTAPLNKESLRAAGVKHPGHTELLAERCRASNVAMMLYLPPGRGQVRGPVGLGVIHVTLHTALRNVFGELSHSRIVDRCRLASDFVSQILKSHGVPRAARVGVAALNPHGGENGLFGQEELELIAPAVEAAQGLGLPVSGPWPCDTLMHRAAGGEFDAVVAMYHDQGHIALKLLGLHDAVNVTLGLPIIRTSVAHGTAFDIAWKGRSNPYSMIQATLTALDLCNARSRE
jgi:4-hydroxythreonine-4-phosphate dehydrogenase